MPLTMRFSSSFDRFSLRSTFADLPGAEQRRLPRPVAQLPKGALRVRAREAAEDAWLPWEATNFAQFIEHIGACLLLSLVVVVQPLRPASFAVGGRTHGSRGLILV